MPGVVDGTSTKAAGAAPGASRGGSSESSSSESVAGPTEPSGKGEGPALWLVLGWTAGALLLLTRMGIELARVAWIVDAVGSFLPRCGRSSGRPLERWEPRHPRPGSCPGCRSP